MPNQPADDINFVARATIARGMTTAELNGWLHRVGQPTTSVLQGIRQQVLDETHTRAQVEHKARELVTRFPATDSETLAFIVESRIEVPDRDHPDVNELLLQAARTELQRREAATSR